jgi:hypothetical protein
MLALERHIGQPLGRQNQFDDVAKYSAARSLVGDMKQTNDAHIAALEERLAALGGDAAMPMKSAWSSVLGAGAAALDSVRKTRVSKSLRDDYTALGLATISYTMLNATALAVGDTQTGAVAKRHLADYAGLIMEIGTEMPEVVLQELRDTGVAVDASAASQAEQDAEDAWRGEARKQQI